MTKRDGFAPGERRRAHPHVPVDGLPAVERVHVDQNPRAQGRQSRSGTHRHRYLRPTPRPPNRQLVNLARVLQRLVRMLPFAVAFSVPVGAGAWVQHAAATTQRVERIAATGVPRFPTPVTLLRATVQGPPTIALQIGHLHAADHPDELAALRFSTGGRGGGLSEVDVNREVAYALADELRRAGVHVTLLDAVVPPGFRATLVLALHADGNADTTRRGYKSAHVEPARQRRDPWLLASIDAAYLATSPIPHDVTNVSSGMTRYYAFSHDRFEHAVAPGTAGLVVEMGYLTHPEDRAWLSQPDQPASALYDGVMRYLAAIDRWHPSLASRFGMGTLDATAVLP